jgi:teichuronic acid biosynthesis glycosyltransferase TuaG
VVEVQESRPSVSVVTPAYNASAVLERVVNSVARQTLPPFEHIVIDDGSSDDTPEVLSQLVLRFPRLRVLSQPRRGAAMARNCGIELARGRYVTFLDADDEWRPEKLARQIEFMESTGTLFSYGNYQRSRYDTLEVLGEVRVPENLVYADLLRGCPIGCLTVAYNQEALGKRYMPVVGRGHDWGLWLALTRDGVVGRRYPGTEAVYHVRRGSLSRDKLRKVRDVYRIYREQEGIGRVRSALFLVQHSVRSLI